MRGAVIAAVLAMTSAPALAQDAGDDWDLTVDEAQGVTLATVGYSSGQALAVRCLNGDLDVLVSGLPPMEGSAAGSRRATRMGAPRSARGFPPATVL